MPTMSKKETSLDLYKAILTCKNVEECVAFFEDLCSITELRTMEQRFAVAKLLDEKKVYQDIMKETGASTATISRVNRSLLYGADGYRAILDHLKENK